jgi:hypothetical protein
MIMTPSRRASDRHDDLTVTVTVTPDRPGAAAAAGTLPLLPGHDGRRRATESDGPPSNLKEPQSRRRPWALGRTRARPGGRAAAGDGYRDSFRLGSSLSSLCHGGWPGPRVRT